MVKRTKDTTIDALKQTTLAAGTTHLNPSAIETINSAVNDLQNFKLKNGIHLEKSSCSEIIPLELAMKWVEITTSSLASDMFIGLVDKSLLKIVPHVINSPHVQLERSLVVVYYAFLFLGCAVSCPSETTKFLPTIYLKCLEAVPRWQKHAKGDLLDLVAATLMTWVAVEYFDYHLSWKFHCEACRFAHILGINQIDDTNQCDRVGEDIEVEIKRKGFWQLMRTEMLFRLYYNKPPVLTAISWTVRFPSVMTPLSSSNSASICTPDATTTIVFIVSSRITLLKMEFLSQLELHHQSGNDEDESTQALHGQIDHICDQIEDLMREWKIMDWVEWADNAISKSVFAGLVIDAYSCIILMNRKKFREDEFAVSERVVRAARMVLKAIFASSQQPTRSVSGMLHFISFYPFVALFSLYYHVVVTGEDPEVSEEDLRDLERLREIVSHAAINRDELTPVANALMVLNGVCRILQDRRTSRLSTQTLTEISSPSSTLIQEELMNRITPGTVTPGTACAVAPVQAQMLPFNAELGTPLSHGTSAAGNPLEYMREMESDFVSRNWHDSWWNIVEPAMADESSRTAEGQGN
ncbi:uncharacterized protein Z518_03626 [Rhinocladiella mackenziei CBS 650.93]|uniref:Rhinocladiella mackenziei CBS 650.93 unplaced genomic scaffold supercont1.3, whole genome shotgun sequence n=1 Tax=Rhinocladiella mackenziei CBS 650.93 TaxID=1442369 RepID=A0A0D2IIT3_9EURO|nr:uncharacterized protein Z518_03626 [Rhinocladiella mackenziei CBS 650.93]KIX05654.1 hypothetical protein Z518_03626 [Rhinocladiella mackenziei CBS 650.93]